MLWRKHRPPDPLPPAHVPRVDPALAWARMAVDDWNRQAGVRCQHCGRRLQTLNGLTQHERAKHGA